ncbi:unnamed protein product [Blepharisma stoltei]|uniref:J domain-containing protein n=1 Tax=Blepharisma stoltei TaxID=1481888 RepID=A0AAU9JWH6_9CILI|nr:unnamed protein product [Blepharisma stoltei]
MNCSQTNIAQEKICKKILEQDNYYAILGVKPACPKEEIKKAYKKLALQLHPDKNQSPKADEAFKLLSKAFSCLSDEEKRKNYNLTGVDSHKDINSSPEESSDFDEYFQDIFSDYFSKEKTYNFQRRTQKRINWKPIIQILPIIILVIFSLFSAVSPKSPQMFSLIPSQKFRVSAITSKNHINYWIDPDTFKEIALQQRYNIEKLVELNYMENLKQECEAQQSSKIYFSQNTNKGNNNRYLNNGNLNSCKKYYEMAR